MLTLALNTASQTHTLALINGEGILNECEWDPYDTNAMPTLAKIHDFLDRNRIEVGHLGEIIAIAGPGSYTALRVGISIANAMAWALKCRLKTCDVFTLWNARVPMQVRDQAQIIIAAGKVNYFTPENPIPKPWGEVFVPLQKKGKSCFYGEFKEGNEEKNFNQKIRSFGTAICELTDQKKLERVEKITPIYIKPPNITTERA